MEPQMWSFPKFSKTSKYFNTIVDFRLAICFTEKLEPSTHGFFVVRKTVQEMGPFMQGENWNNYLGELLLNRSQSSVQINQKEPSLK